MALQKQPGESSGKKHSIVWACMLTVYQETRRPVKTKEDGTAEIHNLTALFAYDRTGCKQPTNNLHFLSVASCITACVQIETHGEVNANIQNRTIRSPGNGCHPGLLILRAAGQLFRSCAAADD
jgi:hypothetical protein